MPDPLLRLLAEKPPLKQCELVFDMAGYPGRNIDLDMTKEKKVPQLTLDSPKNHVQWGPAAQSRLPAKKLDGGEMSIVLTNATTGGVLSLMALVDERVARVHRLEIQGPPSSQEILPDRSSQLSAPMRTEALANRNRKIRVQRLIMTFLGTATLHVAQSLDLEKLQDLEMERCVNLYALMNFLARQTPALKSFRYIGLLSNRDIKDEDEPYERRDTQAVLDFVRSLPSRLQFLELVGDFRDRGRLALTDHLFAAVQAQLPFVRQLHVLDGELGEFSRKQFSEISRVGRNIEDLRFRATSRDPRRKGQFGLIVSPGSLLQGGENPL